MKRFSLAFFICTLATLLFAQTGAVKSVGMKSMACYRDDYKSANPVPFNKTFVYARSQRPAPQSSGSRAIATVPLGSAGNLFTILIGEVNRVDANNDLGSVTFIHRSDPTVLPLDNIGQYRFDVSYDNGANWVLNVGPLNPKGNQQTLAGRYPNGAIYNPVGNTDPDSAYLAYFGAWLPYDLGGSWDGVFTGVARLDRDTSTFTENIYNFNNGDVEIPRGLCTGAPGVMWAVDWAAACTPNDCNRSGILVYKGIWNTTSKDFDWNIHTTLTPPFDVNFDGTVQATALNIAFDPSGQYGWICFTGDITPLGTYSLDPAFYRTTDGGNTWSGHIVVKLKDLENVVGSLVAGPDPTSAFEGDIVVDINGNPHFILVTGSLSTTAGGEYSISVPNSGTYVGNNIWDFTYMPNAEPSCRWAAVWLDSILTFRGEFTPDVSEDNRPQASLSPDGKKVFVGWLETDPTIIGDGSNLLPNLKTIGWDVTTGLATPVVNQTAGDPVWDGLALFASFSPNALESGGTYTIPTVFAELNPSGQDIDPAFFDYVQNIQFSNSDFTRDVLAPVINLLGTTPMTVVQGNAYNEPGATAIDNVDGNISANLIIDASRVNTNTVGYDTVTYNVSDAAGNKACEVRRIVHIVASPDNTPPVITLNGNDTMYVDVCNFFGDPGATATDDVDGNISANIAVSSTVPAPLTAGTYSVVYNVSDGAGNAAAPVTRTVVVSNLPPVITLYGDNPDTLEACHPYVEMNGYAVDNCSGLVALNHSGSVDENTPGTYTITYTATDGANTTTVSRTVVVTEDETPPTITLTGGNITYVYLGMVFSEPGVTANDCVDGDLTASIISDINQVSTGTRHIDTVNYSVTDAAGNTATAIRIVVINTEPDPKFTYQANGGFVQFTDNSQYQPSYWEWDFGDGQHSTLQNPTHNYTSNGTYTVCLKDSSIFNDLFNKPARTWCDTITITAAGIDEVLLDNSFELFPNPTSGTLNVEVKNLNFSDLNIDIYNLLGQQVQSRQFGPSPASTRISLDLTGLSDGVYLVRMKTDKGVIAKRVSVYSAQ